MQRLDGEVLDLDLGSGTVFPHGKDDVAGSGSLGNEVAGGGNQCALAVLLKFHFIEGNAFGKCHAPQQVDLLVHLKIQRLDAGESIDGVGSECDFL